MRLRAGLTLIAIALVAAGCGGDDEAKEQAEAAVRGQIAAYQDRDFEGVCEFQNQEGRDGIMAITEEDNCPDAYRELFRRQEELEGGGKPFDDFADMLGDYEVGEAIPSDLEPVQWEVPLIGPKEASAYLVEEEGTVRVRELFVTPDAGSPPPGGGQAP